MLLLKNKYFLYLYNFFLILVFFFNEFSTNNALSKNYKVAEIKVEEVYDVDFDKSKVIDQAFEKAFDILAIKLTETKDRSKIKNISLKDKKSLIENFSITDEKFINNNYIGKFNVQFNKKKIFKYLNSRSIIPSSPNQIEVFILPVLIETDENELLYLNQNIFFNNWNFDTKN